MKFNKHYLLWAGFGIIYALLILIIPPDASALRRYSLSVNQARLLSLSFVLPSIAIWFAAFYGYVQCRAYAHIIRKNPDGRAISNIATGLMYLAIGLPVSAIATNLLSYVGAKSPHLTPTTTIIRNYIALLVVFIGFWTIHRGAQMLTKTIKKRPAEPWQAGLGLLFIVFCAVYCYITLTNPARQFPTAEVGRAAYYFSDFWLITTIVVPYLLVWFWGYRSAHHLYLYTKKVPGVLYKQSLLLLALGIGTVVISSMFIRFLVSLTTILDALTLRYLLGLLYVFLFIIAAGYVLIAMGAKKMKKMEEV